MGKKKITQKKIIGLPGVGGDWLPEGAEILVRAFGRPHPQPRPRFVNGNVISVVDEKVLGWKLRVRSAVIQAMKNFTRVGTLDFIEPLDGALKVDMVFYMPDKTQRRVGAWHTQTPDIDNLQKLVLDVMQSVGFMVNDAQIAQGSVEKVWVGVGDSGVLIRVQRALKPQQIENGGNPRLGLGF